jgi:hypothetical protein
LGIAKQIRLARRLSGYGVRYETSGKSREVF